MTSILGNEWHISSAGNDVLTENGSIKDKNQIYNVALNTDLKEICRPVLHEFTSNEAPKTVLQIHKIRNSSAPKANEESQVAPRLLKLTLTDGETYIPAFELSHIGTISLKNTPPGTKLLLENTKISSGYLLLSPQNCKVLGGKVVHLCEKWELTKSIQRNRRNINDDEDGPPQWVNFGIKIKTGGQEGNFKSLTEKPKDSKESSEFDQQRQDAIAEASSGAVRKVFSGRVKQNVQIQSANNNKKLNEKPREKKEFGRPRGKSLIKDKEIDDKPLKPSEKVSLFAFLEDKLPVSSNTQDNFYQNHPSRNTFKETDYSIEDQNKYDYKRKKTPLPKEFEKTDFNKYQGKNKNDNFKRENSYTQHNNSDISVDPAQKKNSDNSFNRPKQSNYNNQTSNYHTGDHQYKQKPNFYPPKYNNYPQNYPQNNQNPNVNKIDQYKPKSYPQQSNSYNPQQPPAYSQQNTPNLQQGNAYSQQSNAYSQQNNPHYQQGNSYSKQNSSHPQQGNSYPQQNDHHYPQQNNSYGVQRTDNGQNYHKQPHQRQNVQNDVDHIAQEVQKMTLNGGQFASRSLRQHLNLRDDKRNEEGSGKSTEHLGGRMNIGDEIMAKYWEDGKYYNASIISITDRTFAVMFKDYGNIEEILKTDCQPLMPGGNNNRPMNFNQQSNRSNKQFSGSLEYRRRNYK